MELAFSKGLYEKSALLKAAYSFTEVAYLHLSQDDKNWYVSWHNKPGETLTSEAFENALIEQQLRKELLRESRDLRTVLLARAMASTLVETSQTADETLSNPAVSADTDVQTFPPFFNFSFTPSSSYSNSSNPNPDTASTN